jgi:DNA-binding NarL/FixJ family response regulator
MGFAESLRTEWAENFELRALARPLHCPGARAISEKEAPMHTDTLANLFLEEMHHVRSVEQQIVDALNRIAKGVSVRGLSQATLRILETTEQNKARLNRIFHEIEPAHDDETIFCPSVAERMRAALERAKPQARGAVPSNWSQLSPREVEVLRLIAEGYANKQIAAELAISIKTVEKHRQRMMAKLDLHDTAGVTRYAISAGVVEAVA